jgi:hypothetical protein
MQLPVHGARPGPLEGSSGDPLRGQPGSSAPSRGQNTEIKLYVGRPPRAQTASLELSKETSTPPGRPRGQLPEIEKRPPQGVRRPDPLRGASWGPDPSRGQAGS